MAARLVGKPVTRLEDPCLLRGQAQYLDDVEASDACHLAFVRCPMAHARIGAIETRHAATAPGVVAVITASELGDSNGPFPHPTWAAPVDALRDAIAATVRPETLRLLADDVVRYAGEAVAAVVAEDPAAAADAAGLVQVEFEPLPVVGDVDAALAHGAPLVNPAWGDNIAAHFTVRKADAAAALAAADAVVRGTFSLARQSGCPIEPRGVLARPGGEPFDLTVWSSTQTPHWLREALPMATGLSADAIRVEAPYVGGGFGTKSMVYPEELAVAVVALRLGRAVKWVETRSEQFLAAVHSRDQRHDVELGLSADGRIVGLRDRYLVDVGASNVEALVVPYNTAAHLQGPYHVPALEIECRCVVTNKTPLSAYRGAGRPEAVFALERALDLAARELDLDPVELRRRNVLSAEDMPVDAGILYRDGSRMELDAGDPARCLATARDAFGYEEWRRRQDAARRDGRYVGIGLAGYLEGTGIGPGEFAEARVEASGRVRLSVAPPSQGQGHATTLAQLCADELSLDLSDVEVVQGDTAEVAPGGGTIASRVAVVVGNAVAEAARLLRERLLQEASRLLEAAVEDLEVREGVVAVRGAVSRAVSFAEIAAGSEDSLVALGYYDPPAVTFASGFHIAAVEVEPWTGRIQVLRYLAAHDCGRIINPAIVRGQVAGGVVQGIGSALFEHLVYDDGQLLTGSLIDYLLPRATDVPDIEVHHIETPSARNGLGIKGVGEAGIIGPPAVIVGAVEDALQPFGAHFDRCPVLPADVVAQVRAEDIPRPLL